MPSEIRRSSHSILRNFVTNAGGVAAVELAITLPLFLIVLLGILAYGMYFGAAHSAQQLAADAARASIAGLNAGERAALADEYVTKNAASYPLIIADKVTMKAAASASMPSDFVVTVTYDASGLPIWSLGLVPLPEERIVRVSVIRQGGLQ